MKKLEEKGEKKEDMEKKKSFCFFLSLPIRHRKSSTMSVSASMEKKNVRNKEQTPT